MNEQIRAGLGSEKRAGHKPVRAEEDAAIKAKRAWFVAQLKPRGFDTAKAHLERQGFLSFMPLQPRTIRHARKETAVLRPLFPGYIFVSFDPAVTQWRVINHTSGVATLLTTRANVPQPVPEGLMLALLKGCDRADRLLPPPVFSAGEPVRIVSGPFQNALAEVEQTSEGERVKLLLELMGRAVVAECAGEQLERLRA